MAGDRLRLGMVGTGRIAARHMALFPEADSAVEIVAHLSRHTEAADAAAAKFGGRGFTDIDHFITDGRPDAVFVTLPPAAHGVIEQTLAAARIPFLVEKPVAIDAATADTIGEAISSSGIVAAVGYQWRGLDFIPQLRDFLAEHPARMVLGRFHGGTPATPWWRIDAESGGQFLEQACHIVDLARALVGEGRLIGAAGSFAPLPDFPDATVAGASAALVQFVAGAPGIFTATCLLPGDGEVGLQIVCDHAQVLVDQAGATIRTAGGAPLRLGTQNPYVAQNRAFVAAVRSGDRRGVLCTYDDALGTHRLCLAIHAALGQR